MMGNNDNLLGEFITTKRKERELSIRSLADISGVSFSQLSKIERGIAKRPNEETVEKLAMALNVDKDQMLALAGYVSEDIKQDVIEGMFTVPKIALSYSLPLITSAFSVLPGIGALLASALSARLETTASKECFAREEKTLYDVSYKKLALYELLVELVIAYESTLTKSEAESVAKEMYAVYQLYLKRRDQKIKQQT